MKKHVLIARMDKRRVSAVAFQSILTEYGCIIKTRLGIHDGVLDVCSDHGLIILELVGKNLHIKNMAVKLGKIAGVKVKLVAI